MTSLLYKIKLFLESDKDILRLPMHPIQVYNTLFSKLGYYNDGNWELYGWKGYFNIVYDDCNLHRFRFTGSLFYGDFQIEKLGGN